MKKSSIFALSLNLDYLLDRYAHIKEYISFKMDSDQCGLKISIKKQLSCDAYFSVDLLIPLLSLHNYYFFVEGNDLIIKVH
jgi:hypothetical protein